MSTIDLIEVVHARKPGDVNVVDIGDGEVGVLRGLEAGGCIGGVGDAEGHGERLAEGDVVADTEMFKGRIEAHRDAGFFSTGVGQLPVGGACRPVLRR